MNAASRLCIVAAEPIAGRDNTRSTDWYRHGGPLLKYPVRMALSRDLTHGERALLKRLSSTRYFLSIEVLGARTIEVVTSIETVRDRPDVFQGILDRVTEQVERHDYTSGQELATEAEEQTRRETIGRDLTFKSF